MKWFGKRSITSRKIDQWIRQTRSLQGGEHARAATTRLIVSLGSILRGQYIQDQVKEYCQKIGEKEVAHARHARNTSELEQAEDMLSKIPPGLWLWTMLCLACAVVGLYAEYLFTWTTLPFLLGFKQSELEAKILAAITVTSVVMLEVPIWRLIEAPWQESMKPGVPMSASRRWIHTAVMAAFLVSIAIMLLYTVNLLAQTRTETYKFQNSSLEDIDIALVNQTIKVISIVVMITSAWFLLQGMKEASQCCQRLRAKVAVARLRRCRNRTEEKMARAKAEVAVYEKMAFTIPEMADKVGDVHTALKLIELEGAARRSRSNIEMVNEVMGAPPRTMSILETDIPDTEPNGFKQSQAGN